MKTSKKIALIVAAGCIVLGVLLIVFSRPRGGFHELEAHTTTYESKTYDVSEPFRRICVQDAAMDVRILPAADGQCRVVCYDSRKRTHTVAVTDDTLTVTCVDLETWYDHIGITWGGWQDIALTVYLPEQEYESLLLQTASGDIAVHSGFTFAEAELRTASGDVTFTGTVSEQLSVQSTSGEIEIRNTTGSTVQIATTSGDIDLSRVTADALSLQSTSGDIELAAVQISGEAVLETISGDIALEHSDAGSFRIKTTSGDIEGALLSGKNFVTHTVSGDVRVPPSDSTANVCEITTTSGDIRIKAPEGSSDLLPYPL